MNMKTLIEKVKRWLFGSYIELGKIAELQEKGIKPFFYNHKDLNLVKVSQIKRRVTKCSIKQR